MEQDFLDSGRIKGYHAHIYYAPETKAHAARLREALAARFDGVVGRWHDEAVGPHPVAMYQVAFDAAEFPRIVPWLNLNRGGLDILIHPLSGNGYDDHSRYAMWLGQPVPLRLDVLLEFEARRSQARPDA